MIIFLSYILTRTSSIRWDHVRFVLKQHQGVKWSYIFNILLYFLYLPKISYISSQNPIFFQNYEREKLNLLFWVEISYKHDK
jgi:hypothetical protein